MCDCVEELKKINEKLDNIQLDCSRKEEYLKKMTNHIEFIENTYTNYKSSLEFIKNKVSWLSFTKSSSTIDNKDVSRTKEM
jgi:predicted  nucleic acid-binding Zn-ribbon protein